MRLGAVSLILLLALPAVVASAAGTPRLSGRFPTLFKITAQTNIVGVQVGQEAVKTWTFTPECATGTCPTVLLRPAIATGSTAVYRYVLKPVSATRYTGSIAPSPTYCQLANGQQIQGAVINHQTIVLNVTRAAGGRVVAFSGTQHTVNSLTTLGRAHGCAAVSVQTAIFHSIPR